MLPEPTTKRACAGGTSGTSTGDLLSALPDGILHIILSFLPARHAVQTSVLSRRWRDIWCSMPCINIDEREFEVGGYLPNSEKWETFEDVTTNLLLFHCNSVSLDKFWIYAHLHSQKHVGGWIRRGIKYCPSVLEIDIPYYSDLDDGPFKFPHWGSKLCHLKRLSLSHVELDSCFAELLCSGCPVLVELELTRCFNYFRDITSATLKKLVVDSCYNLDGGRRLMVITAPSLASLELIIDYAYYKDGISVRNAGSLVKASVYIQIYDCFHSKSRRRLLGGLYNVTSLELTHFETMALLHENSDKFPVFPNMRALSLEYCFLGDERDLDSKLKDLGSFLENAPCLEKLTL